MIPTTALQGYKLTYQYWPRDIAIRRNMPTSPWIDVRAFVVTSDESVLVHTGAGIPSAEFSQLLEELPDAGI
jgi:hypothetical protein